MILELSQAKQWRADLARHGQNAALVARGQVLLNTLPTIGENEMEYEKKCKFILCGKTFFAGRKDKEFCSDAHRTAAGKMRDIREPSELAKLMMRAVEFDSQHYGDPSNRVAERARNDALRNVYDAIGAELGIAHEVSVETNQSEPVVHEAPVEVSVETNQSEPVVLTNENVLEKLRAYMTETGFSQGKIKDLTGVPQSTISVFLNKNKGISEDYQRRIMDLVTQDHGMDRR